jgi:prepilin-type N-terminal cleavage/methylation domain-containing protein
MSHTFMKKSLRGFTLIELLVGIAIIGLLSTVIAAPIQTARKKAKDAKKISELDATRLALDQYAEANSGNYPLTLAALSPTFMAVLPSWASTQAPARDRFAYATYTATPNGGISQTFGYHLGVHLDVFSEALNSDRSCLGATQGVTLITGECVWFNTTNGITASYPSYAAGMIPQVSSGLGASVTGSDFDGTNTATTTCTAPTDCVYDVTSQQ